MTAHTQTQTQTQIYTKTDMQTLQQHLRLRARKNHNREQTENTEKPTAAAAVLPLSLSVSLSSSSSDPKSWSLLSVLSSFLSSFYGFFSFVALPVDDATSVSDNSSSCDDGGDVSQCLILYGELYDVSSFAAYHPGGSIILQQVQGQDVTDFFSISHPTHLVDQAKDVARGNGAKGVFKAMHRGRGRVGAQSSSSSSSSSSLSQYERTPMQKDFDHLYLSLYQEGKFQSTGWWYFRKALVQIIMLLTVIYILMLANQYRHIEQKQIIAMQASQFSPLPINGSAFSDAGRTDTAWLDLSAPPLPPTSRVSLFAFLFSYSPLSVALISSMLQRSLCLLPSVSTLLYTLSAVGLGLFWQQMAFLGHDAGHNLVTGSRAGDYPYAWLVTLFFGVSGSWWKRNHNVHHVHTNSIECDPDIQHLPMLAVSDKLFNGFWSSYHRKYFHFDAAARFFVAYQHWLYYPLMSIARGNLYVQSWLLCLNGRVHVPHRKMELLAMLMFWTWYAVLLFTLPSADMLAYFHLVSHAVAGLIHVQITLSHFAMPAYHGPLLVNTDHDPRDAFLLTQFATTMNVDCYWWMDWFHGGLQFQIEHHLLPRLPRKHLRYARDKYIKPFALKYQLPYHQYSLSTCNFMVIRQLKEEAMKAREWQTDKTQAIPNRLWEGIMIRG